MRLITNEQLETALETYESNFLNIGWNVVDADALDAQSMYDYISTTPSFIPRNFNGLYKITPVPKVMAVVTELTPAKEMCEHGYVTYGILPKGDYDKLLTIADEGFKPLPFLNHSFRRFAESDTHVLFSHMVKS